MTKRKAEHKAATQIPYELYAVSGKPETGKKKAFILAHNMSEASAFALSRLQFRVVTAIRIENVSDARGISDLRLENTL
jgi:hypothetical protein